MNSERAELLRALTIEKEGDWDEAHRIAQVIPSKNGSRVHAYLHRREGDLSNASYWYSRAGVSVPVIDLDEEWQELFDEFSSERPR